MLAPSAELPRLDWPFLIAALLGTTVLVALVGLDGQRTSAALILLGFALGVAFLKAEFSFTAAWRRFLASGEAGGLIATLALIAVAAIVIVPVAALVPGFGGAIAPIGPSLVIGAFVFGIGSLHLPAFLALGGIDPVLASNYFGAWGGLAVTLASIAAVALAIAAVARGRGANYRPRPLIVTGGIVIGLLSIGVFLAGHHPWSVTFGFTVWGAKLAALAGFDFSGAEFWQWPGPKRALTESILSDTSSLTDLGMILGAMAAAAATEPFARTAWPPARSLIAAAIGGLLMGWGARIGFGCNIGAFVGGVASGSLHGWIWFAAALGGCAIGIRLRPLFGLSRE
jgi:uncharacterized membrane protein YedE/YeeE